MCRFYNYIKIDLDTANKLFLELDSGISLDKIELIPEGKSTTNYIVYANGYSKKFLLKIYPQTDGKCKKEYAAYMFAKQKINVPTILLFNDRCLFFSKPFMIIEYIEGISLKQYIIENQQFPESIAFQIGVNLSLLHSREYNEKALLNEQLDVYQSLVDISTIQERLLNGIAGKHIIPELKKELLDYIYTHPNIIEQLETKFVFCHGDFNPSNILIDSNDTVWLIDFEYCFSSSIYLDIGKIFRYNEQLNCYRTRSVYNNFFRGYNKYSNLKLYANWTKLAALYDVTGMLSLINTTNPPSDWVKEIELALLDTMNLLKVNESNPYFNK